MTEWRLMKNGKEIKVGDKIERSNGEEITIELLLPPKKPSSCGHYGAKGEGCCYYVSNIGARFEKILPTKRPKEGAVVVSSSALYSLCNRENLFTAGDNEQYSKMFELAKQGITISELTMILYICSEDRTYDSLYELVECWTNVKQVDSICESII